MDIDLAPPFEWLLKNAAKMPQSALVAFGDLLVLWLRKLDSTIFTFGATASMARTRHPCLQSCVQGTVLTANDVPPSVSVHVPTRRRAFGLVRGASGCGIADLGEAAWVKRLRDTQWVPCADPSNEKDGPVSVVSPKWINLSSISTKETRHLKESRCLLQNPTMIILMCLVPDLSFCVFNMINILIYFASTQHPIQILCVCHTSFKGL